MNNLLKISGSIELICLSINNKSVYIFCDNHSNKNYCNNNFFINDFFQQFNDIDTIILLEEPFITANNKIKAIWNDSPHIVKLRKFYIKILRNYNSSKIYIFPIDIRLSLFDISIEDIINNIDNDSYFYDFNITVKEYFKYLLFLLNYPSNIINPIELDSNIFFIKKIFDKFPKTIYYDKLLEKFKLFFDKFIKDNIDINIRNFIKKYNSNNYFFTIGFPFINENIDDFLDQYDKLINSIMEYYTFILISLFNRKKIFIHTGLYHAKNLSFILTKYFNYINYHNIISNNNCLIVDKNIFNNK